MPEEQARVPPPLSPAIEGEVSSPAQRLQSDFRRFVLLEDATYSWWHPLRSTLPARLYRLVVPAGVAHDFASVPRPLWMLCQRRSKRSQLWRLKMSHPAGGDEPQIVAASRRLRVRLG